MSVTFSIEGNPTGQFTATCYENDVVYGPCSYEEISSKIAIHQHHCSECGHYGMYSTAVLDVPEGLDVNLANTNARLILAMLGLDDGEDLAGTVDGVTFLSAVMLAAAEDRDDTGVAPAELSSGVGARMVDCGLRPGYFADTFARLADLATEAVRLGRSVSFA